MDAIQPKQPSFIKQAKQGKQKGSNSASSYSSKILALVYVSSSEIAKVIPDWDEVKAAEDEDYFKSILWQLGVDTEQPIEWQTLQHRNRFNEVVICSRWVGNERQDKQWIESGYASKEAVDKSKNSKMLDSSYRSRALTVDVQEMLEEKDRRSKIVSEDEDEEG